MSERVAKAILFLPVVGMVVCIFMFVYYINRSVSLDNYDKTSKRMKILDSMIVVENRVEVIRRVIRKYKVNDFQAKSVARQLVDVEMVKNVDCESMVAVLNYETGGSWCVNRISSCGAKGITQALESTFKPWCKKNKVRYVEDETIWNEYVAVPVSMMEFCEYVNKYGYGEAFRKYVGGENYFERNDTIGREGAMRYVLSYALAIKPEYDRLKKLSREITKEVENETKERLRPTR